MKIRTFLYGSGGRKFVHTSYVDTAILLVFVVLLWRGLLEASQWAATMGAIWKITGAYLAAHAVDKLAGNLGKGNGPPGNEEGAP